MKHTHMASILSLSATCMLLLASIHGGFGVEAKKEFKVGDDYGWQEPSMNNTGIYSHWASSNRFHVGDSLFFEYKNDSILEVDKWGFYHCNASGAIIAFNNGKSVIKLDRPGPFYFISGVHDHCKNGQRLIVEVMGSHPISHTPPTIIAAPPEPFLAPGPLQSSAELVSVTVFSVFMALVVTFVTIVWCAA
ncbi:hypothetical protein Patl1_34016 [Pistacia atlantica]|uniref:Uncharacterized protein n=1 Tax=Pistacia atlantica TaxID=434234 RepID=A0ACC0ZUA9_9ROSI|nr:hypothetical protein Patl1_34016 [Pistacia atlantica]